MKISASIYSNKTESLETTIEKLDQSGVDLLHVDCNDDPSVFEDIKKIRSITDIPVDLHIITPNPKPYFDLLRETPVEYVTFQHEDLTQPLVKPSDIGGKWGVAVITPTDVNIFEAYKDDFDFILIMATIPGQSGGVFDKYNFRKIRDFRTQYPGKKIHVDGGVNDEVSFILRNMGVYASVSGSYLFKQDSVGQALLQLQSRETVSHYMVKDFMISLENSPVIMESDMNFLSILQKIEDYAFGFTMVSNDEGVLVGISSNADARRAILNHRGDYNQIQASDAINFTPKRINENATVQELLSLVKNLNFPILYLPVVDDNNKIKGTITFLNLIKGEL